MKCYVLFSVKNMKKKMSVCKRQINSFTAIGDNTSVIGLCKPRKSDETAHSEPSHQDLRCLTFSLSILHINAFSNP